MRKTALPIISLLLLAACVSGQPDAASSRDAVPGERHLRNVTQLIFDGDNGEAYFSAGREEARVGVEPESREAARDRHLHRRLG